ncbi:MAG: RDD family protein [Dehalococcoidia bacterium]
MAFAKPPLVIEVDLAEVCPIDLTPVHADLLQCAGCKVIYHEACYRSVGRCATPGCKGQRAAAARAVGTHPMNGSHVAHLADPGQRFWAAVLDSIIYFVAFVLGALVGGLLLGWAFNVLVQLAFWSQGRSAGKAVLNLRVIDQQGRPAGFWRMVLRETIGKLVSAVVLFLGFLAIVWDADRQGWHDKIASTYVTRDR